MSVLTFLPFKSPGFFVYLGLKNAISSSPLKSVPNLFITSKLLISLNLAAKSCPQEFLSIHSKEDAT